MTSWMIGQTGLTALRGHNAALAEKFFNQSTSYVIGTPPAKWATKRVATFASFDAFSRAADLPHDVMYDPESWPATPVTEQQHPVAFISAFASLAHSRRRRMIAAPARDLMAVTGADYNMFTNKETVDQAFLSAHLPAACGVADVYHCQAQADQPSPDQYMALLTGAAAQLPVGFPVWAGLTTLRGDSAAVITACYEAAKGTASGFWLNTSPATIQVAADFLRTI